MYIYGPCYVPLPANFKFCMVNRLLDLSLLRPPKGSMFSSECSLSGGRMVMSLAVRGALILRPRNFAKVSIYAFSMVDSVTVMKISLNDVA